MKYSSLYKILFEGVEESEEFIKSLTLGDVLDIANLAAVLSSNMNAEVRLNDDGVVKHGDGYRFRYNITVSSIDKNGKVIKTWNGRKYFLINKVTGEVYSGDSEGKVNKLVPVNGSLEHAIVHTLKNVIQIGYFMI